MPAVFKNEVFHPKFGSVRFIAVLPSVFLTLLFLLIFIGVSHAQVTIPPLIHFQGVLVDSGGTVLYDIQEADIIFSIVDGGGTPRYRERQHVPIINGAVSVLVGRGEVFQGDDLLDNLLGVFELEGDKLLRVRLEDHTVPQEDIQIVSVPYAMIAEKLSSNIISDNIEDRTIEEVDLSTTLLDDINAQITMLVSDNLTTHQTEEGAHTASSILVDPILMNVAGRNVQRVLQGFDTSISILRNQIGVVETPLDDLEGRVDILDGFLPDLPPDGTLDDQYVNVAGDIMDGDLIMNNSNIFLDEGRMVDRVDISELAGRVPEEGAAPVSHHHDDRYALRASGAFAYGRCRRSANPSDEISGAYNIAGSPGRCDNIEYIFLEAPATDAYIVIITPDNRHDSSGSHECDADLRTTTGFRIGCNESGSQRFGYDFVVFYSLEL